MSRKTDVRWDDERHWFRLPYAAHLAGRTKAEMLGLASDDSILWEQDSKAEYWFERLAILALQDGAKGAAQSLPRNSMAPKERKARTPAQLERQWAKQAAEMAKTNPKKGGGVSRHYEKVLLSEIAEAKRQRKDKGPT